MVNHRKQMTETAYNAASIMACCAVLMASAPAIQTPSWGSNQTPPESCASTAEVINAHAISRRSSLHRKLAERSPSPRLDLPSGYESMVSEAGNTSNSKPLSMPLNTATVKPVLLRTDRDISIVRSNPAAVIACCQRLTSGNEDDLSSTWISIDTLRPSGVVDCRPV